MSYVSLVICELHQQPGKLRMDPNIKLCNNNAENGFVPYEIQVKKDTGSFLFFKDEDVLTTYTMCLHM